MAHDENKAHKTPHGAQPDGHPAEQEHVKAPAAPAEAGVDRKAYDGLKAENDEVGWRR